MTRIPAFANFTLRICCLLLVGIAIPGVAAAQGLFEYTPDRADYSTYTSAEACLAAVGRVRDSTERAFRVANGVLPRTLAYDPDAPEAAPVVATARACSAQYKRPPVPAELNSRERHFESLYKLELVAGREAAADSVLWRQLAVLHDRTSEAHASALLRALRAYLGARPPDVAAAERLIAALDTLPGNRQVLRNRGRSALLDIARSRLDTALMRRHADALAEWLRQTPESERTSSPWPRYEHLFISAQAMLAIPVLRDSGAAGYIAHLRSAYSTALNVTPEVAATALAPIGRKAPALEGEHWFRREDGLTRPTAGKPAIIFVSYRGHQQALGQPGDRPAAPDYAFLRRVSERFGTRLDLTMMTKTLGYFMYFPWDGGLLHPPVEEAEALRHYLHDKAGVPGILGVETTPFTKLPDPDRRRVYGLTANERAYQEAYAKGFLPGGLIVAPDGTILFGFGDFSTRGSEQHMASWEEERALMAMLDALVGPPVTTARESRVPASSVQ